MNPSEAGTAGTSWRAGLSQADARARLREEGFNELPLGDGRGILRIVVDVLREPMFSLLLAAGAIYLVLGDLGEAIVLLLQVAELLDLRSDGRVVVHRLLAFFIMDHFR